MLRRFIRFFLRNKVFTVFMMLLLVLWGVVVSPFGWQIDFLPSDPVAVDAIPDIGENQQIVFTSWAGHSPQDIDDQITYPLTTFLLGIPGVQSIRSTSVFGFSNIYIIFREEVAFYWSRTRILEKLNALPPDLLPEGVRPALGPDATALGQVYWYTIEGRDENGNPAGGWDLHEVRTVQDFYIKYGLNAVEGVAEVASIGGYVQEYQVDVQPAALIAYQVSLQDVVAAVRKSNRDVGAQTLEINQAEYLVRGLGNIQSIKDLEEAVVSVRQGVPIQIKHVAKVSLGPSARRGILDKDGAEVVGGVVVTRYGTNPLQVIRRVKEKVKTLSSGLPKKILADGTTSQLTLVPFYDRSQLIQETLGTLEEALSLEILITILVVVVMVFQLRASLLIAGLLPIAVLMVFIAMKYFGIDANIVALSGIAIAIGTMVDLGIVLTENILKHVKAKGAGQSLTDTIDQAAAEVSPAIVTAVATTIVSFIPVFAMEGAEGKLFRPLAFTKTFALLAALVVALFFLPALARWVFGLRLPRTKMKKLLPFVGLIAGMGCLLWGFYWAGWAFALLGLGEWFKRLVPETKTPGQEASSAGARSFLKKALYALLRSWQVFVTLGAMIWLLSEYWMPLGVEQSRVMNVLFVGMLVSGILAFFMLMERWYTGLLSWCLAHKKTFLALPCLMIFMGMVMWLGFDQIFGWAARGLEAVHVNPRETKVWASLSQAFPGLGEEFMPSLDEGSFLYMPTSMPHAGIQQNKATLQLLDRLLKNIPEVDLAVGKSGRAETALDPAPLSMYENIINYKPEYALDAQGHKARFKTDAGGHFILTSGESLTNEAVLEQGMDAAKLIPDPSGRYFRNWRRGIQSPDDLWNEITRVLQVPGVTSAPKLQPIETRLVMLQTGMRAPMGIKVYGPDLPTIEAFGVALEGIIQHVPAVKTEAVFAERMVGKPYIELVLNRPALARYGLSVEVVQQNIEAAIGGKQITAMIAGRERFPVRVRYPRELRSNPETLANIFIATPTGAQIPLGELVEMEYVRGPQMIKSEDTFLVGYVLFDKKDGYAEVDAVRQAQQAIQEKIDDGQLRVPTGVSYKFSGNYENQIRAAKRLRIIIPLVLVIIFLILYFQFQSVSLSLMIFTGILMAFSGAFFMLWLYGQDWFLNFSVFDTPMRTLFQIKPIHLSVAVWVGFIALFGIATDDGVLIGAYLVRSMQQRKPQTLPDIRSAIVEAGRRRIKPAVMTSATTLMALLPILTSSGRGADMMIPMAIPAFGGMVVATITYFITPVLYGMREERRLSKKNA